MLTIIFGLLGAAAGYLFSPKIAGGVSKEAGAAVGAVAGLLIGWFFKPLLWIGVLGLIGAGAYFIYENRTAKR